MTEYDKTFIGIDYGERRIGLAKSDPTGLIASALITIEINSQIDAIAQLENIFAEYQPNGLVIGYPTHQSGDKSKICLQIDKFIDKLSKIYNGEIFKVDEKYSSKEAISIIHAHGKKIGQDKKRIDRLAAVIILQRFLDEELIR
ncbi:MAG: Holliday junction resolvase RuvX [candidate division Zixibacteria bacterium]|nr:Holliday junction resolvase RuvX [candidate division Zixibacteria bacterium]